MNNKSEIQICSLYFELKKNINKRINSQNFEFIVN